MNRARTIEYAVLHACKGTTRNQPLKTKRPDLWNAVRARVQDCADDEVLAAVKRLEEGGLLELRKYSHAAARPMDYRDYGDNDGRFFYGEDGDGSDIWLSWTHRTHPYFEELEVALGSESGDERKETRSAGDDRLESLKQIARDKSPLGPLREELREKIREIRINPHAQGHSFAVGAFPFYEEYGKRAVLERVEAYVKLAGKGNAPELISAQQIEELRREVEGLVDRWCSDFRQDVESRAHGIGDRAVGPPGENEHNNLRRKLADVARKALREAVLEGRTLQGRAAEAVVAADAPSRTVADASPYVLHPEIDKVSGKVFRDGHFREAAFNAYVAVIGEVKAKTHLLDKKGKPMDGEPLMRQAFDCENNKTPPVRFNDLKTESERDEQQGFMHLFLGLVRLRHSKAHSVRPFDDPSRAHEYLCLASLLMRLLDMATVGTVEAKEPAS